MFNRATFLPNGQLVGIDRGSSSGVAIPFQGFNPSPFMIQHHGRPHPPPPPFIIATHPPQHVAPLIMRGGCGVPGCDERHSVHNCDRCGIKNSHRARHCPTITGPRVITMPNPCRYGASCRDLNNPVHVRMYAHPFIGGAAYMNVTVPCRYGVNCYQSDSDHMRKYSHPSFRREPCMYGATCYQRNPDHHRKYSHP